MKTKLIDCNIWKKTKLDSKNRIVLPKKLRQKLGLNGKKEILWISCRHKDGKSNEFVLEVGVKQ